MAKKKEPCKWRYKGICRHGESKWYDDKVTGDKKERCQKCSKYEK